MGGRGKSGPRGGTSVKEAPKKVDHLADLNHDERKIAEAYERIAPRENAYVSLSDLREASGLSRRAFNAAAASLHRKPGFTLESETNQKALTAKDRYDSIKLGGSARHMMTSSRPRN